MYTCYSSAVMVPFGWAICLQWGMSVVDVAGNMQEEFVQAVWTVHTYILTCVWDNGFYIGSYCMYYLYIIKYVCMYVRMYVCMYVCMYSQHCLYELGQQVLI